MSNIGAACSMLDSEHIEWILDFLSGSGPMGKLLLQRKDGFVFSEANSFPGLQKEYRDKVFQTVIGDFLKENDA